MKTMADGEREKFEAWCGDRYDLATKKDAFGERQYKDRWVQGAFVGWKASIAARQPVGQEPVGQVIERSNPDAATDWLRRPYRVLTGYRKMLDMPVGTVFYTALPEQAVDLGQFRRYVVLHREFALEELRRHKRHGIVVKSIIGRFQEDVEDCDRLLVLIDSKAVGK